MIAAIFAFAESSVQAGRLADELGLPNRAVTVHRFPDRESLVRVERSPPTALLYRSLDDPNAKLVELLLAVSALRANGAARVILIAPYLGYMRQDRAFQPGQAVSQQVVGRLLAERIDALLTVDPHLHRTHSLSQVVPGIPAVALSAAPVLAAALGLADDPLIAGPDDESAAWLEAVAAPLGLETLLGAKQRRGDRQVEISFANIERCKDRHVVLIDDLISSCETMREAALQLRKAGAARVEVLATHCLSSEADLVRLTGAGVLRVRATDTVPGPAASLPIAGLLASAIRHQRWAGE